MYCNSVATQIINPQHAADHVSTQVIEHEHFPYGLAVRVEYGRIMENQAIGRGWIVVFVGVEVRTLVQV